MSIGFALAVPFIVLAFSIDEIGHGIVKVISMGKDGQKAGRAGRGESRFGKGWKLPERFFIPGVITLAALIIGVVLVLVWTPSLGTQNKVTATVCFGALLVLVVISKGLHKLVERGRANEVDLSSSSTTSQSLAEP